MSGQTQEQQQLIKAKKNLLWFGIFSIIMIFAGLTSAYIVSKGSQFWVHFSVPNEFLWSTICVVAGSVALFLAIKSIKSNKNANAKILVLVALLTGLMFTYFQYTGWRKMAQSGNAVGTTILNKTGKYGLFYSLSYQGKEITFDGYDFFWQGQILSEDLKGKMKNFAQSLYDGAHHSNQKHTFKLDQYGSGFTLNYQQKLITYSGDSLLVLGESPSHEQYHQLTVFAESIINDRGDFLMSGRYGKDFTIHYKGSQLEYQNRKFYMNGKPLSAKLEDQLQGEENGRSSYIFAFVVMHWLHLLGGLVALLVIWIRSILNRYSADNYLGIQLGTTYWHFLGILWIYLYAFLIFIH